MDEAPRPRPRSIRTLGQIATQKTDDVLIAQWTSSVGDGYPRQDVAISSDWASEVEDNPFIHSKRSVLGATRQHRAAVRAYENHMADVVRRLLEAIDSDIAEHSRIPLAYEAPPVSQEEALASLAALVAADEITVRRAATKRDRILGLSEASARLWVLAGLYRSGHISSRELAVKRSAIARVIKR
jgi:hypothetical protein